MPSNIHDALFKSTFSQVEHAVGELKTILPAALSNCIDFTTLTLVPGTFVDDELAERHTDLLFSVNIEESRVLLYLLYEHQSRVDPLMAFRLLVYMVRAWTSLMKEAKAAPNGRAALATLWRYVLAVSERFDPEEPAEKVVARLVAAVGEDAKEELVTIAELLEEQGLKRGLLGGEEGGEEGGTEGCVAHAPRRSLRSAV